MDGRLLFSRRAQLGASTPPEISLPKCLLAARVAFLNIIKLLSRRVKHFPSKSNENLNANFVLKIVKITIHAAFTVF